MRRIFLLTIVLLIGISLGIFLGFILKSDSDYVKESDIIAEKPIKYRNFPPEFWGDHYNGKLDNWNTYISLDNKIAFKYPKNLVVFQEYDEGNIYLFPVERINKNDFVLNSGFVVVIEKYGDYEVRLEDSSQVTDYSIIAFRTEDFFDEISGVTFFNKATNSYIVKAEPSELGYKYIYSVYKNEEEQETGMLIVSTIVTDKSFDLGKYREYSTNNYENYSILDSNNLVESPSLKVLVDVPKGYSFEETMNLDNKSYSVIVRNDKCALTISNNPEYVGFSTSGALCANAGLNSCLMSGKYLIPIIGDHMTIVKDVIKDSIVRYRGVVYGDKLSASLSAQVPQSTCVSDMLNVLYSLQSI